MAKIISQSVEITFSTLIRDNVKDDVSLISPERLETLDAAMQELFGDEAGVVVEVAEIDG
jgi:hypothetical protein